MKPMHSIYVLSLLMRVVVGCGKESTGTTTALHQAAEAGDVEQIRSLIAQDAEKKEI